MTTSESDNESERVSCSNPSMERKNNNFAIRTPPRILQGPGGEGRRKEKKILFNYLILGVQQRLINVSEAGVGEWREICEGTRLPGSQTMEGRSDVGFEY